MINRQVRDNLIRKAMGEVFRRVSTPVLKSLIRELSDDYSDGPRYYHTFDHIAEMLALSENHPLNNPQAFKAAVLYHDCVYDPQRYSSGYAGQSNESQSAIICLNALEKYGVKKETVSRARDLILMTKDHVAPEGDYEAALFLDLDMAILGMPQNRYQFYARATAHEFLSVFTPEQYIAGRRAFLNGVLERNQIFKTIHFESMDEPARGNIRWELESLESIVTRLIPKLAENTPELATK